MSSENSYDDDKRRLEELFNDHDVLTGSIANGRVKVICNSSAAGNCFERMARAVKTDDNFLRVDENFFQRIARAVRTDDNFSRTD